MTTSNDDNKRIAAVEAISEQIPERVQSLMDAYHEWQELMKVELPVEAPDDIPEAVQKVWKFLPPNGKRAAMGVEEPSVEPINEAFAELKELITDLSDIARLYLPAQGKVAASVGQRTVDGSRQYENLRRNVPESALNEWSVRFNEATGLIEYRNPITGRSGSTQYGKNVTDAMSRAVGKTA